MPPWRTHADHVTRNSQQFKSLSFQWWLLRVNDWLDRFGDELDAGQCEELLSNLKMTRSWHCCAHGRPTVATLVEMAALTRVLGLRGCVT